MLVTKITLYMPLIAIFNATFCLTSQKKYFTMHQCSVTSHFYIGGYLSANFGWVTWNEITWYKWTTLTDTIFDRKRDLEPTVIDKAYSKTDGSNRENRFTSTQIMTHFSWLTNMSHFIELLMRSKSQKPNMTAKIFEWAPLSIENILKSLQSYGLHFNVCSRIWSDFTKFALLFVLYHPSLQSYMLHPKMM